MSRTCCHLTGHPHPAAQRLHRASKRERIEICASSTNRYSGYPGEPQLWQHCRRQEDIANCLGREYRKHCGQHQYRQRIEQPVFRFRPHYAHLLASWSVQHLSSVVRSQRRGERHRYSDVPNQQRSLFGASSTYRLSNSRATANWREFHEPKFGECNGRNNGEGYADDN